MNKWTKAADKILRNESNIYQEWIDWLTYDYNEVHNKNILSLIHFFEQLGSNDESGKSRLLGLFGNHDGDRRRENILIRRLGKTLRKEKYIKRAVLEAEYIFAYNYSPPITTYVYEYSPSEGYTIQDYHEYSTYIKKNRK